MGNSFAHAVRLSPILWARSFNPSLSIAGPVLRMCRRPGCISRGRPLRTTNAWAAIRAGSIRLCSHRGRKAPCLRDTHPGCGTRVWRVCRPGRRAGEWPCPRRSSHVFRQFLRRDTTYAGLRRRADGLLPWQSCRPRPHSVLFVSRRNHPVCRTRPSLTCARRLAVAGSARSQPPTTRLRLPCMCRRPAVPASHPDGRGCR